MTENIYVRANKTIWCSTHPALKKEDSYVKDHLYKVKSMEMHNGYFQVYLWHNEYEGIDDNFTSIRITSGLLNKFSFVWYNNGILALPENI